MNNLPVVYWLTPYLPHEIVALILDYLPTLNEIVPLLQVNKATNALICNMNLFWFKKFDELFKTHAAHPWLSVFHQKPYLETLEQIEEEKHICWDEWQEILPSFCDETSCDYSALRKWLIVLGPSGMRNLSTIGPTTNSASLFPSLWMSYLRCKNPAHYKTTVANQNAGLNYYESVSYFLHYKSSVFDWLFDWNNGKYNTNLGEGTQEGDLQKKVLTAKLLTSEDPLNTVIFCETHFPATRFPDVLPDCVREELLRLHEEMNEIRESLKKQEQDRLK